MRIKPIKPFLLACFLFFSLSAAAFQETFRQSPKDEKVYNIFRLQDEKPVIDGVPDEDLWLNSAWKSGFTQRNPNEGAKASQKTEFSLMYDDDFLYIAFKLYDNEPEKIDARISRRDSWGGDAAVVYIDSYHDKQTAFMFGITAGGVKNDGVASDNSEHVDMNRDPLWHAKTALTDYGWAAEMRIPLSELRFPEKEDLIWGLQVARYIFRSDEYALWQHIPQSEAGWAANFGEIHGLHKIKKKRKIEITPYILGKYLHPAQDANTYDNRNALSGNIGLNGKVGISNNTILDFAINPDFGQVEADASEVNLTAYESYFPEKRPFFTEGSNILDFRLTENGKHWARDNLFYSRRIGGRPKIMPDIQEDEYYQMPDYVKIPFAAKLTGKSDNGWSIGIMNAMTAYTTAEIHSETGTRKEAVEPFTNYFAARLQKDINKGRSRIGGMITSVNRNIKDDQLRILPKSAYAGGIDAMQYSKNFKYFVSAKFVGSRVNGDTSAIGNLQTASSRYFQRPDARHVSYNPEKESLSGYAATLAVGKDASKGWRFRLNMSLRSPEAELNDIGYMRNADGIYQYFWTGYKFTERFSIFQVIDFRADQWAAWDFGGKALEKAYSLVMSAQFVNKWNMYASYNHTGRNRSNDLLRGGPSVLIPASQSMYLWLRSDQTKAVYVSSSYFKRAGDFNSLSYTQYAAQINIQPSPRLSLSINANYSESQNALQYITTFSADEQDLFLLGNINQETLALNINMTFNLNPQVSFQYYGAPFVSSALFSDYKKLTQADAEDYYKRFAHFSEKQIVYNMESNAYMLQDFGQAQRFDNPDFNFMQFRSNFVARWEYRPGSQLFLVWSQERSRSLSDGNLRPAESLGRLFRTSADDVFMIKLSYLINV